MRGGVVAGVLVGVVVLAGCGGGGAQRAALSPGSTLERTLVDPDGDGVLAPGPGEPLVERVDLAPAAPVRRTLLTLVQLSDAHVTDEESPLRAEAADRLGGPVASAFRPQEALTTQVLAAALRSAATVRPDAVVVSGDLVDNAQENELDWALGLLRGGRVTPDSGAAGYDGLQSSDSADPFLYRPDLDAPRHEGLLEAAQQPVDSPGSPAPWLPVVSNHDVLVQGLLPADDALAATATGRRKLVAVDPEVLRAAADGALTPADAERLALGGRGGTYRDVPPDPRRRPLSSAEAVARIAAAAGVPATDGRLQYDRALGGGVRLVALDTADRAGGSSGVLPPGELEWLAATLAAHRGEHLLIVSPTPLEETRGGEAALRLLDATPGVVAVLAGDTHRARIRPRRTAQGGYWLVRTPSLVDSPQALRALRLVELVDGRVALETWLVDHAGDPAAGGALGLAGISRDLAYLDVQGGRPQGWAGDPSDRNARLYLP